MNTKKEIELIEFKLKATFNKDRITRMDVIESNKLFEKWKILTKNKEETSFIVDSVLENEPKWQTKN
jgi:hypothetical protein